YLAIVLAATVSVAAIRRWRFLAGGAYVGAGFWSLAYLGGTLDPSPHLVSMLHLVGLAVLGGVWLARSTSQESARVDPASLAAGVFAAFVAAFLASETGASGHHWAAAILTAMLAVAAWRSGAVPLLHAAGVG